MEEDMKLSQSIPHTLGMETGKLLPKITLEKWTVVSCVHPPPPPAPPCMALIILMYFLLV